MVRAQRMWPASCNRFTSVSPETSSSLVRVSETVRTAICTGTKPMLVSIRSASESGGIDGWLDRGLAGWRLRHRREGGTIDRPFAMRELVKAACFLAEAAAIHPLILHQPAHIRARLGDRNAF